MTTTISGDSTSTFGSDIDVTGNVITDAPAFSAYKSSDQSLSSAINTKITFDTELHDNQSSYDSSRFTVPSNQDGLYLLGFNLVYNDALNIRVQGRIYKNGSNIVSTESYVNIAGQDPNCTTTFLVPLVAGDYIEIFGYASSATTVRSQQNETFFWGYKLA